MSRVKFIVPIPELVAKVTLVASDLIEDAKVGNVLIRVELLSYVFKQFLDNGVFVCIVALLLLEECLDYILLIFLLNSNSLKHNLRLDFTVFRFLWSQLALQVLETILAKAGD